MFMFIYSNMTIKIPVPKKLFLCDFYVHAHSLDIQVGKWKWWTPAFTMSKKKSTTLKEKWSDASSRALYIVFYFLINKNYIPPRPFGIEIEYWTSLVFGFRLLFAHYFIVSVILMEVFLVDLPGREINYERLITVICGSTNNEITKMNALW